MFAPSKSESEKYVATCKQNQLIVCCVGTYLKKFSFLCSKIEICKSLVCKEKQKFFNVFVTDAFN